MTNSTKSLFNLPKDSHYLNMAYMSPQLRSVSEAGIAAMRLKENPVDIGLHEFFHVPDQLRASFSDLIECEDYRRIALMPSVSYGMANVLKNLTPDGKKKYIINVDEQFPSMVLPFWQKGLKINTINPPADYTYERGEIWNDKIINQINDETLAVVLPICHWADGTLFDIKQIKEACTVHNALLIIDGTQSVGARPFSLKDTPVDALIVASYKWMLGPYNFAFGYFGPHFDGGRPIEDNWANRIDSDQFYKLTDYEARYRPLARRYEVGESAQFIKVPMMIEALERIKEFGPEHISAHNASLKDYIHKNLVKDSSELWMQTGSFGADHLFGIHATPESPILKQFDQFREHNIHISRRGDILRIAPYLFSDEKDMDQLIKLIKKLSK